MENVMQMIIKNRTTIICTIITVITASFALSCTQSADKANKSVYKANTKLLYDYYDNHDTDSESLVVGLSCINRCINQYSDGATDTLILFGIQDYDTSTGESNFRTLTFDKEDMNNISIFLDSCLTENIAEGEEWRCDTKCSATLIYEPYNESIFCSWDPSYILELQISPKRLKEILKK